jgi:tetratricopeptide (TPR) repeat protein
MAGRLFVSSKLLWLAALVIAWSPQTAVAMSTDARQSSSQTSDSSGPANPQQGNSTPSGATSSDTGQKKGPDLSPPRSDRVNADDLGSNVGESSSKDTQIDLSPPENDAKAHPKSAEAIGDAEAATGVAGGVAEFHPWDPHKAAKNVEVGDYYFRRKNYSAAESRYREALYYKDDDATATYRLAVCLEKMERPNDALAEYESYLRILPYGPQASESKKAVERLKKVASDR